MRYLTLLCCTNAIIGESHALLWWWDRISVGVQTRFLLDVERGPTLFRNVREEQWLGHKWCCRPAAQAWQHRQDIFNIRNQTSLKGLMRVL
jgi:hypothetical protein